MATTPKFDYPDSSSPTVTITFPRGGSLAKDGYTFGINQVKEETKDGDVIAKKLGSGTAEKLYTVRVKRKSDTETDIADLVDFIDNTVEGATRTFEWTDSDGTKRTVRCMNDTLQFRYHYGAGDDIVDKCVLVLREVD